MFQFVASDSFLLARANDLHARLLAGGIARLYSNDFDPTPASVLADFRQCSFGGYHSVALAGILGGPVKVREGLYRLPCPVQAVTCTGLPGNTVYGVYVVLDGKVCFSGRFSTPLEVSAGLVVQFSVQPEVSSASFV